MQNTAQTISFFLHLGNEGRHRHFSKLEQNTVFFFSLLSRKIVLKYLSSQRDFSF